MSDMMEQLPIIIYNFLSFGVFAALISKRIFMGFCIFVIVNEILIRGGYLDPRWRTLIIIIVGVYFGYIALKNIKIRFLKNKGQS